MTPNAERRTPHFPDGQRDELVNRMETSGPAAVIDFIAGFDNPEECRKLFAFAQKVLGRENWSGKNFDGLIEVVNAGIQEGLRQAEAAPDPELADRCRDFANILSYNLSADLAECWPGDETPRERRHLEAGLQAANNCLRWREQLRKGPFPFAIAYWARGIHELSLGRVAESIASFGAAGVLRTPRSANRMTSCASS